MNGINNLLEKFRKKGKGILPIISDMPKDNHSVMQLYLDGQKNNFFTFFSLKDISSLKINSKTLLKSHKFLGNKSLYQIKMIQKNASENVFKKRKYLLEALK